MLFMVACSPLRRTMWIRYQCRSPMDTIDLKGAHRVHIIHSASGDEKREVTTHLTCRAGKVHRGVDAKGNPVYKNVAQPKPVMICRGLGKRIFAEEKTQWDPGVHGVCEKKALADTNFMVTYAHLMAADPAVDPLKSSVWPMDNLGAHQAPRFKPALKNKCNEKAHSCSADCS